MFFIPYTGDYSCSRFPWATVLIIALCTSVYAYDFYLFRTILIPLQNIEAYFQFRLTFGFVPNFLLPVSLPADIGQYTQDLVEQARPVFWPGYQFVTHTFMHANVFHLLLNMLVLWIVGPAVEDTYGAPLFLLLYVLGGTFSALAEGLVSGGQILLMVGASGSVAAITGTFLCLMPWARVKTFIMLLWFIVDVYRIPALFLIVPWFIGEVFIGFSGTQDNIAHWAHAVGMVFGVAAYFSILRARKLVADIEQDEKAFVAELKADSIAQEKESKKVARKTAKKSRARDFNQPWN